MMCNLGKLDKEEQEAVFRCDLNAKPSELTEAELNQIQAVEDKHKLSLIAVE
jgi:hypothetical protein